jgi:hypothetical protein
MWFKIDYNKLAVLLLPTFLRGDIMIRFIQVLLSPISTLHSQWMSGRSDHIYRLEHNGQVCYLRKVLNDSFDNQLRRIYITDGSRYERNYVYTNVEQQPRYLKTIYLRQSSDYADTGVDFRIVVPVGFDLNGVVYQMKATIDYYKLASKRYKIEFDE